MEINIEDLLIGDEIIVLGQVPKYIKILEIAKNALPSKWYAGPRFKTIRSRINVKMLTVNKNRWDSTQRKYVIMPVIEKTYVLESPDNTDLIKKIDLNHKRLWLVKRELI